MGIAICAVTLLTFLFMVKTSKINHFSWMRKIKGKTVVFFFFLNFNTFHERTLKACASLR